MTVALGNTGVVLQGSGGFGEVHAARWRNKDVAVKRLSPSIGQDSDQYRALVREIGLSSKFNSDRLVKVYGACLAVNALSLPFLLPFAGIFTHSG